MIIFVSFLLRIFIVFSLGSVKISSKNPFSFWTAKEAFLGWRIVSNTPVSVCSHWISPGCAHVAYDSLLPLPLVGISSLPI